MAEMDKVFKKIKGINNRMNGIDERITQNCRTANANFKDHRDWLSDLDVAVASLRKENAKLRKVANDADGAAAAAIFFTLALGVGTLWLACKVSDLEYQVKMLKIDAELAEEKEKEGE